MFRIRLAQAMTFLTRAGALAGAWALPRIRRALRTGLQVPLPTVSPPLAEADLQEAAAALEGEPSEKIRKQASRPIRPTARLRTNDL